MALFKRYGLFIICLVSIQGFGQLRTLTSDGNWSDSGIWTGGLIADTPSEDATMNNNVDVTVLNAESFTIGNLTANNNNSITINAGGALTLSPGNFLTAGNGTTITVHGTFTINGDFQVNNNVTLVITGTMIVTGNVDMGNNGSLNVSGGLSVGGNFTGGNNTSVTVGAGGSIDVDGNLSVGNGSTLNGTGTFSVGGSCSDGTSSFCEDGQLPVELLFFSATPKSGYVQLDWATASELNFDYFTVERSDEGESFNEIGVVAGNGNSTIRNDYSFQDISPRQGRNYYRIKSVDFDGYTEYFNIEKVDFKGMGSVRVYPNPVKINQQVTIAFGNHFSEVGFLIVQDLMGRVITKKSITSGDSHLNTEGLSSGVYLVKVFVGLDQYTNRLVVR